MSQQSPNKTSVRNKILCCDKEFNVVTFLKKNEKKIVETALNPVVTMIKVESKRVVSQQFLFYRNIKS